MCSCAQNTSSTSEAEIEPTESVSTTQADVERKAYDDGWRDGYLTAVVEHKPQNIKVSGEFAVTVQDIIPFYGNSPDGKLLVVSFYQDYPFLLNIDQSILNEVEVSEAYVFSFEDCILLDVPESYLSYGSVSPNVLSDPHVIATKCRVAQEHELGMESLCSLTYELYEEE